MQVNQIYRGLQKARIAVLVAGVAVSFSPSQAAASEKIIFKYGGITESVALEELQEFAATGEISPSLNSLFKNGKQDPQAIRWIIRQQFSADTKIVSDLLNTAPGEYVLSQTGNVVGTKSERANVKALRGALVKSAKDDNLVSLIELLENYPTKEVYVDGKLLAKARNNLDDFVDETNKYIKIPWEIFSN